MGQNDLAFPYFAVDSPMWDGAQMPSFLKGLEARSRVGRRENRPLEHFGQTMDAFARIIVPADPNVPGDRAAGDRRTQPFFKQMIRLIQAGTVPDLGAAITEDDGRIVFGEL